MGWADDLGGGGNGKLDESPSDCVMTAKFRSKLQYMVWKLDPFGSWQLGS